MSTPSSFTPVGGSSRGEFYYDDDDSHGQGLVTFAGVMLMIAATLNTLYGIAAIAKAHVFVRHAHYVFGNLSLWGWVVLALGILQFFAVFALWRGTPWARWFAVACASINALFQTAWIPAYPILAMTILTLDIIVIYGLLVYGGRRQAYVEQKERQAVAAGGR
jgi:uncharacterized membrane protein (DUF2068 family)